MAFVVHIVDSEVGTDHISHRHDDDVHDLIIPAAAALHGLRGLHVLRLMVLAEGEERHVVGFFLSEALGHGSPQSRH